MSFDYFGLCLCEQGMTERERQVMKKLKEVVDKQRDEIRAKDREITLKNDDIEAVRKLCSNLGSFTFQTALSVLSTLCFTLIQLSFFWFFFLCIAPTATVSSNENQPRLAAQNLSGGGPGERNDRTEGGIGGRCSGKGTGSQCPSAGSCTFEGTLARRPSCPRPRRTKTSAPLTSRGNVHGFQAEKLERLNCKNSLKQTVI